MIILIISDANISKFSDGEIKVINENVRKHDCFIIQSTGPSQHSSPSMIIMELFILVDALKRGSADSVRLCLIMGMKDKWKDIVVLLPQQEYAYFKSQAIE